MSKYDGYATKFSDPDALVGALEECGYKAEVHAEAKALTGYAGDTRPETAEIIIPRKQVGRSANDLGFKRQMDGTYTAIISEFDSCKHNAAWMTKLRKSYLERAQMSEWKKQGYTEFEREVLNGKTVIRAKIPAKLLPQQSVTAGMRR